MSHPNEDRDDIKDKLTQIAATLPFYRLGKIMGHTGIYVGRKMAAFAYEDGMGLKIDKNNLDHILISYPNVRPFRPMGRQMNGWVVLMLDDAEQYMNHNLVIHALHLAELANPSVK